MRALGRLRSQAPKLRCRVRLRSARVYGPLLSLRFEANLRERGSGFRPGFSAILEGVERKTRFELATLALARRCSTTELLPRCMRERRLAPTSVSTYAGQPIFLAGNRRVAANAEHMTGGAIVGTVLVIGGALDLATFLWITQARVRALGPDK